MSRSGERLRHTCSHGGILGGTFTPSVNRGNPVLALGGPSNREDPIGISSAYRDRGAEFPKHLDWPAAYSLLVVGTKSSRPRCVMARCGSLLLILVASVLPRTGSAAPAVVCVRMGLAEPGWFKVSNGHVVAFNRTQKTPSRDSIEVFDREGRRVARVDVLGQLPGAAEVTLDDVSVREARPIVAGATIRKAHGGLENMLLYFTWEGLLDRSVSIPPAQEINKIELDESGNAWTLIDYFGRRDDDTAGSLIFVYDHTGHLMKGLLRRTDYPAGFKEGPLTGGVAGFGLTQDGFWFWQPTRRRMC
jgi:hypothetical protein